MAKVTVIVDNLCQPSAEGLRSFLILFLLVWKMKMEEWPLI
jgi:hypothetical protein